MKFPIDVTNRLCTLMKYSRPNFFLGRTYKMRHANLNLIFHTHKDRTLILGYGTNLIEIYTNNPGE